MPETRTSIHHLFDFACFGKNPKRGAEVPKMDSSLEKSWRKFTETKRSWHPVTCSIPSRKQLTTSASISIPDRATGARCIPCRPMSLTRNISPSSLTFGFPRHKENSQLVSFRSAKLREFCGGYKTVGDSGSIMRKQPLRSKWFVVTYVCRSQFSHGRSAMRANSRSLSVTIV